MTHRTAEEKTTDAAARQAAGANLETAIDDLITKIVSYVEQVVTRPNLVAQRVADPDAGREWTVRPLVNDFRRTAVRNLVEAGLPRSWAKALTGHKSDRVFERYDIVDAVNLRKA